jgi:dTDP-4-dehydrorhamnose 3,5-epimerase
LDSYTRDDENTVKFQIPIDDIHGVRLLDLDNHSDFRGSFDRLDFGKLPSNTQNSFAVSRNTVTGTTRGLHFQKSPHEQAKLIYCLSGSIDDYFLDLRTTSMSYGKWATIRLNSKSSKALFLPRGMAHGFQTLEPDTTLCYFFDSPFIQSSSAVFSILDSRLGIQLALPISSISELDRSAPDFYQQTGR